MTKTQTAKFSSYNRLVTFLTSYATIFAGLTRLLKCGTDFIAAFTALKLILPTSTATKSSPVTSTKNKDFLNLIDLMVSLANRAYLLAIDTTNAALEKTFKIDVTTFKTLPEAEQILLAQNVLIALNNNSVALIAGYDIAAIELTDAAADIALCQDQIAAPSTIIGNNKTFNEEIEAAFVLVDAKIALLDSAINGKFKTGPSANTSLISNFEKAKKLVETTKHTALSATITDINNLPIEGATASIALEKETKEGTSNIGGIVEVEEFISGTYNVTYSAATYITQVVVTEFHLGETTTATIVLLAVV